MNKVKNKDVDFKQIADKVLKDGSGLKIFLKMDLNKSGMIRYEFELGCRAEEFIWFLNDEQVQNKYKSSVVDKYYKVRQINKFEKIIYMSYKKLFFIDK